MSVARTVPPVGAVPVAVAALATRPASRSVWVSAYVAVAVTDCPGASVPAVPGHVPYVTALAPVWASATTTLRSVWFPVFVIV